ncbi:restriction endonuclease subunit S [Vibrio diabolicus]|mgnify:CR=1 FL=1|uniref:restriction endonuclease subunit S n=1 Tax=Vibrio diabolicus TaxID=50719 RepID=UPI002494DDA3|nr:restriction endonuclease subunit S [Vibrio diabolicus]
MSCNWEKKKLRDVVELVIDNRGRNPKSYSEDGGIPVIDNYLIVSEAEVNLNEIKRYIDNETYNTFIRKHINGGDVLLTLVGNGYGKVAITPNERCVIIQNTIGLRCNKDNDNQYLYYLLRANRDSLMNLNRGAAQPSIKVGDVLNLEFNFPPVEIQKTTACILGSIDKKILSNTQANQTLEEMAQAIFKSWFVDFDPVKAKMNGEQPEGMDAATASLFPEKLVESELGLIPEGWDIATIKDFGSVVCGKTPSKKNADFYGGDVPFIKIPDTHGKVFITETTDTLTQAGDESQPKKRIPENSICVSCIATVGQVFITTKPSHTNQQINSVVPHDANSLYYLLFKFKGLNKHFHDLASGGSATLNMNTRTFSNIELVRPTADVMEAFHNTIGGLMQKMLTNQLENSTLAELRDTLLPKLLSGEIELGQAQELAEVE